MQLGFDITGDTKVGDQISEVVLSSSTMQIDSNNDGVLDSTKVIPAVIKSFGFIGVDYDTNTAVGNSQPSLF